MRIRNSQAEKSCGYGGVGALSAGQDDMPGYGKALASGQRTALW
ncbi:hypothetical protein [Streptomyces uncialis]|nr:hypothetical protein OG924_37195 [Streptomyces uncialis]